jgi:hypothetical protein
MEYKERLLILCIQNPFLEDNINSVIVFLVNKYNYLLKTMICGLHVDVDEIGYAPVDMVEIMILDGLFPYVKTGDLHRLHMKDLISSHFYKYITRMALDLFNENKYISSKKITFHDEAYFIARFKVVFSMDESYWDILVAYFLEYNGKILRDLLSYIFEKYYDKNTNEMDNKSLIDKIDASYRELTLNFLYFFSHDRYMACTINTIISNYSELYSLYCELSKNIKIIDDIIMIIISKANILDD